MRTIHFIFLVILLVLAGCNLQRQENPAAGSVSYSTERTDADGSKTTVSIAYTAPENDSKGSSFSLGDPPAPAIAATFGGQYEIKPIEVPSQGHNIGQYILYGCGAVCVIAGLGLIGIGKHVKLGSLAFIGAGAFFTVAVTIEKFSWIYAYLLSAGVLLVLAIIGWALWSDYKDDKKFNLSIAG